MPFLASAARAMAATSSIYSNPQMRLWFCGCTSGQRSTIRTKHAQCFMSWSRYPNYVELPRLDCEMINNCSPGKSKVHNPANSIDIAFIAKPFKIPRIPLSAKCFFEDESSAFSRTGRLAGSRGDLKCLSSGWARAKEQWFAGFTKVTFEELDLRDVLRLGALIGLAAQSR